MILIDGLDDNQQEPDLLEQLVAEPSLNTTTSLNYDYRPALLHTHHQEEQDTSELKTSNRSTSTCADSEAPARKCNCMKTRCQKNYCECFKAGLTCTSECECVACGNKERLFLTSSNREITKCKCQKSHCLKKYCQCHSSGKKCGLACKCFECYNTEEQVMEVEKDEPGK